LYRRMIINVDKKCERTTFGMLKSWEGSIEARCFFYPAASLASIDQPLCQDGSPINPYSMNRFLSCVQV
jgi:hypothetical protein